MARRGFGGTALRAALGAVTGVAEGLQQRQVVADEKKRMADAAAMDRARLLMQLNYRIAPDEYDTIDPAARSILPSLEMPSTARSALPPMTMPSTAPRPSAGVSRALSAALNRDFKVDPTQPSITRPGFGAPPLAMDGGGSRMTEMFEAAKDTRAAQEAIAASVDLGGGMKVRFNAPESAAQVAARTLAGYEAQKRVDAAIEAQGKAGERKAEGDAKSADIALAKTAWKAAGLSDAKAEVAARTGAKYGDVMMSDKDMKTLGISYAELKLAQDRFNFDKKSTLKEGDAQRKAGTNLMVNANKRMIDFENKVDSGELTITVEEQILRKLATDFGNEKTPFAKILSSGSYAKLAKANPEFAEYIRNIDGFAEGETATVGRPSNYRTQMAKFLSGIAAGSPSEVIRRVQERRAGFMAPYVDQFYGGDMKKAEQEAVGSFRLNPPALTIDEWMDANPQRSDEGESDLAYMARGKAATGGK